MSDVRWWLMSSTRAGGEFLRQLYDLEQKQTEADNPIDDGCWCADRHKKSGLGNGAGVQNATTMRGRAVIVKIWRKTAMTMSDRLHSIPDRIFALATLGIVIALDVVTTMMALDLGSYEANPFVRPFTDSLAELAVFKFGVFAIFAIPTLVLKVDVWTKWIWVVAGVHGVVVCLNLWGVWRLGGFGW